MILKQIILREVCNYYGITTLDFYSRSKKRPIPDARHMAIYFLHREGFTWARAADILQLNHDCANRARWKIEGFLCVRDERTVNAINAIESNLLKLAA